MWAVFLDSTRVSPTFTSREEADEYAVSMADFDSKEKIKIEIGEEIFFAEPKDLLVKPID